MSLTPIDPLLVAAITMVLRRARRDWPSMPLDEIMFRLNFEFRHDSLAPADLHQAVQDKSYVVQHLHAMQAMGLITVDAHDEWRFTNQAEIKQHLGAEARPQSRERVLPVKALPERPRGQATKPPEPPDRGGRGGGGDDEGNGPTDGGGRGIGEVLDHPVLFALSASDFDQYVDQMFSGAGAP